jgi:ECF sigma factor
MDSQGSVTRLRDQLRSGDARLRDAAARDLWQRYVPPLLALARHHLDRKLLHREDEDDVLQSMYASFCTRQQRGRFEELEWHIRDLGDPVLRRIALRKLEGYTKRMTGMRCSAAPSAGKSRRRAR